MRPFIAFILLAAPLFQVHAQTTPAPTKEFRLLTIGSESITGIFYDLKGEKTPLIAPVGAPSGSYPMPSTTSLRLYKEAPPATPDAKPVEIPFAEITLQGEPPLLVLLQAAPRGSPLPYTGRSLSFTRGAQPANSGQFFNLSPHQTAVVYGPEKFMLEPGQSRTVPFSAPKERGEVMPFKVGVPNADGSWTLAQDLELFKEKNGRQLIFLVDEPDAQTGRPSFKIVAIMDWFVPPKLVKD